MISVQARSLFGRFSPQVWRVLCHSMIFGLALNVADLLFNFYLVSLGYDVGVAGLLSTVNRSAGILLGMPIGLLIDRAGAQRALLLGVIAYAFGWLLLLLTPALWALVITQFCIGAAYILAATSVTPLLAGVTRDDQRAAAFGMNAAATLAIGLVGSALAGFLPAAAALLIGVGPRDSAAYGLALGGVIILALLALLPVLRSFNPVAATVGASLEEVPVRNLPLRTLVRYALAGLLLGIAGGLVLPFQNLFFRQVFGLSDAAVGLVLAMVALGMGFGALIGAPLSKRLGLRRAAALLRSGAVPAMLLMLFPLLPVAMVGFLLRGLFIAASYPLNDALVMQATPLRQRGIAASMMSVLWSGGWALAAVVSGWVQLRWGFAPILIASALGYLLSALAIYTLRIAE